MSETAQRTLRDIFLILSLPEYNCLFFFRDFSPERFSLTTHTESVMTDTGWGSKGLSSRASFQSRDRSKGHSH